MAGPGFAPSASVPTTGMALADDGQMQLASADPSAIAIPTPNPQASSALADSTENSGQTLTSMAPAQSGPSSVDALNRGITQTNDIKPMTNLYAATAPAQESGGAEEPAPEVAAAADGPASITIPVPSPSPKNSTAEIVVAKAETTTEADEAEAPTTALAVREQPKKQSIFSRLFNSKPTPPKAVPAGRTERAKREPGRQVSPRGNIELASVSTGNSALPGVRLSSLFEIQTGTDEDGEDAQGVEMASAAGLARLAPNGLHTQTAKVDVSCLKPGLVRVLKLVERHYGRDVVVTSGYRSPRHNRKVGGASHSRHTTCEAADIQVAGVSKWELAKYLRSMPQRGGVGTYCHTQSVHVDIGTERDWNWRCRRRK